MDEHSSIPGKLDELSREFASHVRENNQRLLKIEGVLDENTTITRQLASIVPVVNDIRETQIAKKVFARGLKGAGGIAAALTAIGAAAATAWHYISGK